MCWTKHQIHAVELTLGAPVILDDVKKRIALLHLFLVLPLTGHYKGPHPPEEKGRKEIKGDTLISGPFGWC